MTAGLTRLRQGCGEGGRPVLQLDSTGGKTRQGEDCANKGWGILASETVEGRCGRGCRWRRRACCSGHDAPGPVEACVDESRVSCLDFTRRRPWANDAS